MARRKDHTREELTQIAIDAGRRLVASKGTSALTARNVAKEIGYTPGTLYNVFENIDALAAAINIESMESFTKTIRRIFKQNDDAETRLRSISQAYLDFHKEDAALWSLLFAQPLNHQSEAYQQAVNQIFDQVTEAIQPLSKDQATARQNAKILWSTLHGICLLQQSGKLKVREEDSSEVLVARFLEQFLK